MAMNSSKHGINVTPMIDILLVLLIVFMVITPLKPKGLEARVPQEEKEVKASSDDGIVVQLGADGSIRLNQESHSIESLAVRLGEVFLRRADRVCFVRAAGGLDYQEVAAVVDVAKGAGSSAIGLLRLGGDDNRK